MTLKKFDENICVDIDSKISEIRKDKLKRFIIDDFKLNSEDKFGSWMANQVSSHIQGYFTNRVQTKVEMEGVIQIYFTDNDTDKVISLGIPSSFSSSSLDITSILPDSVTQTMGYFETGTDLLDIVNGESQFTKRAKCLVNSFLIQINAENPVECFVRS